MNIPTVGTMIALLGLVGSGYAWDFTQREAKYQEINTQIVMGDVELELQRVELELKLYRSIMERRDLTPDEQDRQDYLLDLREALLDKQRG